MRTLTLALALSAIGGIAACGNDDSGGGPIPIDSLPAAAVDAICKVYVNCGYIVTMDACRAILGPHVLSDYANLVAAVHAGKIIYHADQAGACFATVGGGCDRNQTLGDRNGSIACDGIFEGAVGDGGACELPEECISDVCNASGCSANTCCMGTCVGGTKPVRPQLGDACPMDNCVEGYCDLQTTTCMAYLADGQPCTDSSECESNRCTDTCQPLVATGATCTTTNDCENIGDTCNSTTKTCTTLAGVGGACTSLQGGECSAGLICDSSLHCATPPKLGEACNPFCTPGSYCDTTTKVCVATKAGGSPCQLFVECTSNQCDATTHMCLAPPVCY